MDFRRRFDFKKTGQLNKVFGYTESAYTQFSKQWRLMPNFAVYCKTRVIVNKAVQRQPRYLGAPFHLDKPLNVLNMIGYGFDDEGQPDAQYFGRKGQLSEDRTKELIRRYKR